MASPVIPYDTRQNGLFALCSIFGVLSILAVTFRIWSRRLKNATLRSSEYALLAALVFTIGYLISIVIGTIYGVGQHIAAVNSSDATVLAKTFIASMFPRLWATSLTRISILLMYIDIFPSKVFHTICWAVMGICSVFLIAETFATALGCMPFGKYWDMDLPGTCVNVHAQQICAAVVNMLLDFIVIALPQHLVWDLKLAQRRRLLMSLIFSVGLLTIVMAILRVQTTVVNQFIYPKNISAAYYHPSVYGSLETSLGVITASLPTLLPVLEFFRGNLTGHSSDPDQTKDSRPTGPWATLPPHENHERAPLPQRESWRKPRYDDERELATILPHNATSTGATAVPESENSGMSPGPEEVWVRLEVQFSEERSPG